jgi:hypothetical protein
MAWLLPLGSADILRLHMCRNVAAKFQPRPVVKATATFNALDTSTSSTSPLLQSWALSGKTWVLSSIIGKIDIIYYVYIVMYR